MVYWDNNFESKKKAFIKNEDIGRLSRWRLIEFKYDPFGRRIEKKITENGIATIKKYFYDNEDIIFEYDENGNIGNRYIHGLGIDEPLALINNQGTYYYHVDGLGSVVALTDSSAKVVQDYQYDSFGNLKDQKNRIKQPYTYTGREWDKETGLYYYRARYYDADIGRFISFDPLLHLISRSKQSGVCGKNSNSSIPRTFSLLMENPKFLNPQVYAANDPVNSIDPSGLLPQTPGEWLNLINNMKKIGKLCYECNDIEKYMLRGSGQGIADECLSCCDALSKIYGGVLKHTVRDTCVATLCMKK